MRTLKSNCGQALIEDLILVCLMAVATIGVVRSINHAVNTKFIEVDYALRGITKRVRKDSIDESLGEKRDLSNFLRGAGQRDKD